MKTENKTFAVGDQLQHDFGNGTISPLVGTIVHLTDRKYFIEYEDTGCGMIVDRVTLKDTDGGAWTEYVPTTEAYQNVYSDGTVGLPRSSKESASQYTRFYKTRIGIIKRVMTGDKETSAVIIPTDPLYRDPTEHDGINPYAE